MPRDEDSSYNYIDFAELARLLAQAAVATPAVVQAPANTAPSAPAVQQAVTQVAQAIAPIIAPTVPPKAIIALAKEIADEVVVTPDIIKADTGVSVSPKVIDNIVSEVSSVIPQKVIDTIENSLANAAAEQVVVPTPSQILDERSQAISEYRDFFGIQPAPKVEEPVVQPFTQPMTIAGQTPAPAKVENTSVSEADISKIMEQAANAAAEQVVVPTPSQALDERSQAISEYRNFFGIQPTPTTTTPTTTTPTTTTPTTTTPTTTTPVTSAVTSSVSSVGLDNETKLLIQSLQNQIATLTNQQTAAANIAAANTASVAETQRQSIIATLTDRFAKYGLTSLANKVRELAIDGATEATITLALQETPEYQQRFAANAERLKKNLQVLSPAEYINLEDSYRQVLRAYGLRQFDTDEYVRQFIANDMSAAELSDRVVTAVQRVQNADPATARTLRDYYGISNADLVAYVLDPNQQLQKIQRQVAAAEIGAAARVQGLEAGVSVAEQLAAQGVTQAQAQKGYATIADILPTAEKLSQIYGGTLATYGQGEAEQEVFNSLAEAQKKRERLTARELAAFSGQSGLSRVALTQGTQGQF